MTAPMVKPPPMNPQAAWAPKPWWWSSSAPSKASSIASALISAPAAPEEVPEARANPYLSGHEAAEASLIEAHAQGKLPHAIIIGGPRGIGKATLAFRLARFLLSQGSGGGGLFAAPPTSLAIGE